MPLDGDGGFERVILVVGMIVGGSEVGCGEGEVVFWVGLIWEGRGLAPRRWNSRVAALGFWFEGSILAP